MAAETFRLSVENSVRGTEQIERLVNAMNKLETSQAKTAKTVDATGKSFQNFGQGLQNFVQNPVAGASQAITSLAGKLGPLALGFTGIAAAVGTAAFGIAKLAQSFGDLYEQQSNNALRLGVSVREYGLFAQASKEAGLAQDALVATMRGLSKALADADDEGKKAKDALRQLGIQAETAFGGPRPMKDLLLDIADALGKIDDPAKRANIAIKVLGRGGMEVLPLMNSELRQTVAELEKSGVAFTEWGGKVAAGFDRISDKLSRWASSQWMTMTEGLSTALLLANPGLARMVLGDVAPQANKQPDIMAPFLAVGAQLNARNKRTSWEAFASTDPQLQLDAARKSLAEALADHDQRRVVALRAQVEAIERQVEKTKQLHDLEKRRKDFYAERALSLPVSRGVGSDISFGNYFSSARIFGAQDLGMRSPTGGLQAQGLAAGMGAAMDADQQLAAARAIYEFQIRKLELMTGPGGELAAANAIANIRIGAAQREYEWTQDKFALDQQIARAMEERELALLALARQRLEMSRQEGAQIFDALTARGSGIGGYLKGMGLGIGRNIFSNVYAETVGSMRGKFPLPGQTNADGSLNFMGRVLQGTPFGKDAGALQMSAAQMQLQAANMQLSAAGAATGVGGLTRIMSGAQSNPLIFNWGAGGTGIQNNSGATGNPFPSVENSRASTWMRGIGYAAAVGAAGYGVASGIKQGGARGALTASSSALGAAALIPGPQQPFVMAGALIAGFISSILPDPKAKRGRELEEEAGRRRYDIATGATYVTDYYGRQIDYDARGGVRVNLYIDALDAKSIQDRSQDISEAVRRGLQSYQPLVEDLRAAVVPV